MIRLWLTLFLVAVLCSCGGKSQSEKTHDRLVAYQHRQQADQKYFKNLTEALREDCVLTSPNPDRC